MINHKLAATQTVRPPTTPGAPMGPGSLATAQAPSLTLPLPYIVASLVSFAALGTLAVVAADSLARSYFTPAVLALTHVATLGWGTMIVMGAMYQLVPVVLGVPIRHEWAGKIGFWVFAWGALVLIASFWAWRMWELALGGVLLLAGVGLFLFNMARTLAAVRQWNITGRFLVVALAYFTLTAGLGVLLALDKQFHFLGGVEMFNLAGHAHLGIVGWFTLIIMGVSYKLVPMFSLSHATGENLARIILVAVGLGLAGLSLSLVSDADRATVLTFGGTAALGAYLFAYDTRRILSRRLRKPLGLTLSYYVLAVGYLVVGTTFGLTLGLGLWEGRLSQNAQAMIYAYLGLGGWVSLTIMGMLHKIVPFLVWFNRYSTKAGREPVPLLKDMLDERFGWVALGLWNAGLLGSIGALAVSDAGWLRMAGVALAAAAYLFVFNILAVFWR